MNQRFETYRIADWCIWAAFGLAVIGGFVAILAPAGGPNRVLGVALPLAIAALALAASQLTTFRTGWLRALLYAASTLAVLYAMTLALSLPLRLAVEGSCRPAPSPCPLGFELPQTSGENFAVYAAVICGALALVFIFLAVELRYLRRPSHAQPPPGPPPPP